MPISPKILTYHQNSTQSPQTIACHYHNTSSTMTKSTPWHLWHSTTLTTQSTAFMGGTTPPLLNKWPSHTDNPSSGQNMPAIPPGSSTSIIDWTGLGGFCQANGGSVAKIKHHTQWRTCQPHSHDMNIVSQHCTAPESHAQLQATKPVSINLCTQ